MASPFPTRAAQYLRMSREHQNYSFTHQRAAIAAYALQHDLDIVRTYEDAGISGLSLERRAGLQALLADVVGGQPGFGTVLVYDVSRWGRFQDLDESAHYEFLCRSAGVEVIYCAEPFSNDGSLVSAIVKHLKRGMAAEFSRDLSAKIAHAQRDMSLMGFWRGSPAPYGFRRCAVAPDGSPFLVMEAGQRKALQGYHTVLVRGPETEVATVRRIFSLFAIHGLGVRGIAAQLNAEGVPAAGGRPWSPFRVDRVLRDEKYAGVLVAGRVTSRLKTVKVQPRRNWVRVPGGCPALVDAKLFRIAQANLKQVPRGGSDAEVIADLRAVLADHGHLNNDIIAADPRARSPAFYIRRFGGLLQTYALAGYEPTKAQRRAAERIETLRPHLQRNRRRRETDEEMIGKLRALLARSGRLSTVIIDDADDLASSSEYRRRFGDMHEIYRIVGYTPNDRQARVLAAWTRRHSRPPRGPAT